MHTEEKHNDIDELISLYISGTLDEPSFARLKQWSLESEVNRVYVRNRLEVWFSSGVSGDGASFNKNEAFDLFRQRIAKAEEKQKQVRRFSWKVLYRVAAVILILLLPLGAYWQGKETVKHTFADMTVEAPLGARTKLHLPDGTLVWLNAGSKIVYSQGFGVDDRKLSLEGEGYFEVTRNEKVPFEVKTKEVNLKVLGTKFNFRNEIRPMQELYLVPNERMVLDKLTGKMTKSHVKTENASVWINDELFFDEELLEDIAKKLMRSYDVEIEVADSLKNKRFYGSFKIMGNTIDEVLQTIASTMKYRHEDEKYILY